MIAVKFNGTEACCRDLREQKSRLDAYRNNLIQIRRKLPLAICVTTNVGSNLNNLTDRLGKLSAQYEKLYTGLADITAGYRRTEAEITGTWSGFTAAEWLRSLVERGEILPWFPELIRTGTGTITIPQWVNALLPSTLFAQLLLGSGSADWTATLFNHTADPDSVSGSVFSMNRSASGTLLGGGAGMSETFSALGYSGKVKHVAEWTPKDGNMTLMASAEGNAYLGQYEFEGHTGIFSNSIKASVGNVGASGAVGMTLMENGRFSPSVSAKVKAEASVAKGEASYQVGSDQYNYHGKVSGTLLGAEAEAKAGLGMITYEDGNGNKVTAFGAEGKVGAEAYVAEGKASGGFTFLGIKVDATVSGKLGGAGVSAGGRIVNGSAEGEIGLGLGAGAGLKISVDWTGFEWPKIKWPKIGW